MNTRLCLASFLPIASLSTGLLLLAPATSHAQQLLWDGGGATVNGPGLDGPGTWDYTTANWYQYSPTLHTWTSNTTAVIGAGGAAGTITVGAPIALGGIFFNA